jgi:hypothetical protein
MTTTSPAGEPGTSTATTAGAIRASDQERELVIARLHAAVGEGRLDLDEAEQRVVAVYGIRYRDDLAVVVDDLPAEGEPTAATGDGPLPWRTLWEAAVWHGLQILNGHPVPRPAPQQLRAAALTLAAGALVFVVFVVLGAGLVAR